MKKKNQLSGQSLVEFALILPILLFVVMGLFEIGRYVFYFAVLNNAVREGTRYAIVQPYEDYGTYPNETLTTCCCSVTSTAAHQNICNEIQEKLFSINELDGTQLTITHKDADGNLLVNTYGDPLVKINLSFDFHPIVPAMGLIGNFNIDTDSTMLLTAKAKN
jgi:hypothetical protein